MIVKQAMIESFLAADFAPGRICQPYGQCPGVPTRRPQSHLVWLFLSEVRGFLFVCPFVAPALPVYLGVWCLLPEVLLLVTLLPGSLSSKDVLPYALLCPFPTGLTTSFSWWFGADLQCDWLIAAARARQHGDLVHGWKKYRCFHHWWWIQYLSMNTPIKSSMKILLFYQDSLVEILDEPPRHVPPAAQGPAAARCRETAALHAAPRGFLGKSTPKASS